MRDFDNLPQPVADALIKDLLRDLERVIQTHGLSEVLVGLAMYCNMQSQAKLNKSDASEPDQEAGYFFRDAAKSIEVAASLTYRTKMEGSAQDVPQQLGPGIGSLPRDPGEDLVVDD